MKADAIPANKLLDLESGSAGLRDALAMATEHLGDPVIEVVRDKVQDKPSRWSLHVTVEGITQVFILDSSNVRATVAAHGIYLVDLVNELQGELGKVLGEDGMIEGIEILIPLVKSFKGKPS